MLFKGTTFLKMNGSMKLAILFRTMVEDANEYNRYTVAVHVESRTVFVPRFIIPITVIE